MVYTLCQAGTNIYNRYLRFSDFVEAHITRYSRASLLTCICLTSTRGNCFLNSERVFLEIYSVCDSKRTLVKTSRINPFVKAYSLFFKSLVTWTLLFYTGHAGYLRRSWEFWWSRIHRRHRVTRLDEGCSGTVAFSLVLVFKKMLPVVRTCWLNCSYTLVVRTWFHNRKLLLVIYYSVTFSILLQAVLGCDLRTIQRFSDYFILAKWSALEREYSTTEFIRIWFAQNCKPKATLYMYKQQEYYGLSQ